MSANDDHYGAVNAKHSSERLKKLAQTDVPTNWWSEESDFFGSLYLEGDDSIDGHLGHTKLDQKARTIREVEGIKTLLRLKPDDKILDIPCGAGRHSLLMAELGFDVIGVDINKVHLSEAERKRHSKSVNCQFVNQDMRSFKFINKFDVIINMFYSFGFFSDHENREVLKNIKNALEEGGKFLMHTDVNLSRVHAGTYKFKECRMLKFGGKLLIEEAYDSKTSRIKGKWTIISGDQERASTYSVQVYTVEQFKELCLAAGFSRCDAYGDWNGSDYNDESEEIVFVAQ